MGKLTGRYRDFFSDFFAARYHLLRSSKMAQMSSTLFGVVAQLAPTMAIAPISNRIGRLLLIFMFTVFDRDTWTILVMGILTGLDVIGAFGSRKAKIGAI